jgi:hypothetical protein
MAATSHSAVVLPLLTSPLPGEPGAGLPSVALAILSVGFAWAGATGQHAAARGIARS